MRILLVGKTGSIVHWPEYVLSGCLAAGHQAHIWSVTGQGALDHLRLKLLRGVSREHWHATLAGGFARALKETRPDLILYVSAFLLPEALFTMALEVWPDVPRVGWVGDRFDQGKGGIARCLHHVFYTDSAFLREARGLGFPDNGSWLPLAVDQKLFLPGPARRDDRVVFVANATPWRIEILRGLRRPVTVHGRGWRKLKGGIHHIQARRLPQRRLPGLYAGCRAVLNVRNEANVLAGLNQRSFEPLACGTPVLNDALPDLERCFVPGEEILVWRDIEELNEWHERVIADPVFAARIGSAGRRRVLAEHTYRHRIQRILDVLSL